MDMSWTRLRQYHNLAFLMHVSVFVAVGKSLVAHHRRLDATICIYILLHFSKEKLEQLSRQFMEHDFDIHSIGIIAKRHRFWTEDYHRLLERFLHHHHCYVLECSFTLSLDASSHLCGSVGRSVGLSVGWFRCLNHKILFHLKRSIN